MIKVSVLYPNSEGKKFDIDYYCNNHMSLVKEKLGTALKGGAVEVGLSGGEPGAPAPFLAMGHMYFDSMEEFQAAFLPHVATFMGDLPNYTDITPVIQISEVKLQQFP
ncbi:EthD family reductase [Dethiobacter alkaliphilus]|uniref:Ethyl tert-butyl ether degradation EthD n=1 Tax=Dethiobacter alkaliphilus AHT 1 TaxID=555088 RepID=C0GFE5_DETAL|nr:EthD family reductase [Dethiobacter alkaliphilus]EEG77905.1 Ethyl tert-butyl ether degradation EthD [Dethiobacter alkaliphilus AHT 1]